MKIPRRIRLAFHILGLVTVLIATGCSRSEKSSTEQSSQAPEATSPESPTVELLIQEKLLKEHQRLNQ